MAPLWVEGLRFTLDPIYSALPAVEHREEEASNQHCLDRALDVLRELENLFSLVECIPN